jgi:hypothetical protein
MNQDSSHCKRDGDFRHATPAAVRRSHPERAKAGTENNSFVAAVNRCATQKQGTKPSFSAIFFSDL